MNALVLFAQGFYYLGGLVARAVVYENKFKLYPFFVKERLLLHRFGIEKRNAFFFVITRYYNAERFI